MHAQNLKISTITHLIPPPTFALRFPLPQILQLEKRELWISHHLALIYMQTVYVLLYCVTHPSKPNCRWACLYSNLGSLWQFAYRSSSREIVVSHIYVCKWNTVVIFLVVDYIVFKKHSMNTHIILPVIDIIARV